MLCPLVVILILAFIIIPNALMLRSLLVCRASWHWWLALASVCVAGFIAGCFAVMTEYSAGPDLRIVGFPLPEVAFHREGGDWVDFPTSPAVPFVNVALWMSGLSALFAGLVLWRLGWWPLVQLRAFPVDPPKPGV